MRQRSNNPFRPSLCPPTVSQVVGKYEIEGNQITVIYATGQAERAKLEKDTIRSDDGKVYVKARPGTPIPQPKLSKLTGLNISNVSFIPSGYEPRLPSTVIIGGMGWEGGSDVKVKINGQDVSKLMVTQSKYTIVLKGTTKELNLHDGKNVVILTVNGTDSSPYEFKQALNR